MSASSLSGSQRMLGRATERLHRMHRSQVHRDPWPAFANFDVDPYPESLRRTAAVQWAGRARAEYGSVHQFSGLTHALCEACIELPVLGALARLQTDEVRHAELCAEMALACWPEGPAREPDVFRFPPPRAPWSSAPKAGDDPRPGLAWAAEAVLVACCIGETLSRPMLEAIAVVTTDTVAETVARQILRDEHLHATFGWETLSLLLPRLDPTQHAHLCERMRVSFGSVESTTACGIAIEDVAHREIEIGRGDAPNLGTLTDEQYAMIFFATMEAEVVPGFEALGLPALRAWHERTRTKPSA